MVHRHYSLNLKPGPSRTLYVYAHTDLAQKYSVGLQEIFVSQEENDFPLPWLRLIAIWPSAVANTNPTKLSF
jgi:hypothetical protein